MEFCTGCRRPIDPAFDSLARDGAGRTWHSGCLTRAHGAGREDQTRGVGALWAWAIVTVLFPLAGLAAGIVYLFRNRVGPGLALIVEAVALTAIYWLLLASASAATGTSAGVYVAHSKWGKPACGQPQVVTSTPQNYQRAFGTGYFLLEPLSWADENRCAIVINPNFPIRTAVKRCHVIVHEWGHLAGYRDPSNTADPEHSDDPRSVMFWHDEVVEVRERRSRRWVARYAFRPCYAAVEDGAGGFG